MGGQWTKESNGSCRIQAEESGTFIVARVLDEIIFEHAHEDGGQETSEQHHRHAAVDDGEPMNLQHIQQLTLRESSSSIQLIHFVQMQSISRAQGSFSILVP